MARKRPFSILRALRLFALVATFLGSSHLASTILFYNSSFATQGIILDWASSDEAAASGRTPIIAFIDFRDRKRLAAPQSAAGTENEQLGHKIQIRYNPDNPDIFRIDTPMGMWGSGIMSVLYGLVPFLLLSFLISSTNKRPTKRPRVQQRKSTLNVSHLVDHSQSMTETDRPVVRRMR
ncbi:MAG: DUF3592 domain-containing protein [Rhodobacteraceae bacterium]|nr:DUF3592 domain-containing protein [Paracoccaceae bacterium]